MSSMSLGARTEMATLSEIRGARADRALTRAVSSRAVLGFDRVHVVDLLSSYEDEHNDEERLNALMTSQLDSVDGSSSRFAFAIYRIKKALNPLFWIFLVTVAFCSATAIYSVDWSVVGIRAFRAEAETSGYDFVDWLISVTLPVFISLLSAMCVEYISEEAAGSGIPELKSILVGSVVDRFLNFRTLLAKVPGTIFALGSGLSVGKEGPFVHISACVSRALWKLPMFQRLAIGRSPALQRQVLAAAVAAGVTATFGAPIGGTLFSIEVTATFFSVKGLWQIFFTAVITMISAEMYRAIKTVDLFEQTKFDPIDISPALVLYILLGCLCGIVSSVFLYLAASCMAYVRRHPALNSRFLLTATVTFVTAVLSSIPFLKKRDHEIINEVFRSDSIDSIPAWSLPTVYLTLLMYSLIKLGLTAISICLPLPVGIFTPVFACGAALGRWFGEFIAIAWSTQAAGSYAVAGAAGLTAGVFRTISTAVMIFELTGQLHHMLPVLTVVLVSYGVASQFSSGSIYDLLLEVKGLPHLPTLDVTSYRRTARDVMQPVVVTLSPSSTFGGAREILTHPRRGYKIPIVDVAESESCSGYLIGTITTRKLEALVDSHENLFHRGTSPSRSIDEVSHMLDSGDLTNRYYAQTMSPDGQELSAWEAHMAARLDIDVASSSDVDRAPLTVVSQTPLPKLHFLFTMLGLSEVFVVESGRLVGAISIEDLA